MKCNGAGGSSFGLAGQKWQKKCRKEKLDFRFLKELEEVTDSIIQSVQGKERKE